MYTNINSNSCISINPSRKIPDLHEDIRNGLLNRPRSIPPKYFYDARGSELFDRICDTAEYYPTRIEDSLLDHFGSEIIRQARPDEIVELGSGTSQKTRHLFDACEDHGHICRYAPFDVCEPMLQESAAMIRSEYEWLDVTPLSGDYNAGLENLPAPPGIRLYVFLGGTIGNFDRGQAREFLREVQHSMQPGDHILLGVDRVKDKEVLDAAYNDREGITAEFNLNILNVLNRELNADFNLCDFHHDALFDTGTRRVEMYLVSRKDLTVSIEDLGVSFEMHRGERILTEISCKYEYDEFAAMLLECDLEIVDHYEPGNRYFSLFLARC